MNKNPERVEGVSGSALSINKEKESWASGEVKAAVEIKDNKMYLTAEKPAEGFVYGAEYQVTIPAGMVKDAEGNALREAYTFAFHTEEGTGEPFAWEDSYAFYSDTPRDVSINLALQGHMN